MVFLHDVLHISTLLKIIESNGSQLQHVFPFCSPFIFLLCEMRKVFIHTTNTLPYYTQCFKKVKIKKIKLKKLNRQTVPKWMGSLCHHRCLIKEYICTALGCPNWGLRSTDGSRDYRLLFLKITTVLASNYSPLEVLDQKSFAKKLVARGHKQFEKE